MNYCCQPYLASSVCFLSPPLLASPSTAQPATQALVRAEFARAYRVLTSPSEEDESLLSLLAAQD